MKRRLIVALFIALFGPALLPVTTSAETEGITLSYRPPSSAEQAGMIRDFVARMHARWGLSIIPSDYEVQFDQHGITIKPNGATLRTSVTSNASGGSSGGSVDHMTTMAAPTPNEAREQVAHGLTTVQQDTVWYQPECYARLTDSEGVGYMDTCSMFGEMNYQGATRRNMAFRSYATCGARDGGPEFMQVGGCTVHSMRNNVLDSPELFWNDWSPKSSSNLGSCESISLSIGIGPVSAGATVNTCEELIPRKGEDPANLRVSWNGKSYYGSDVRETGLLIGIGSSFGTSPNLNIAWAYRFDHCWIPPKIGWWCAL